MSWLLFATTISLFVGMQALIQPPYCNGVEPLSFKDEKEYVFAMVSHIKVAAETLGTDFNYLDLFKKVYQDVYPIDSHLQVHWDTVPNLSSNEIEICRTVVSENQKKSLASFIATKKQEYLALSDRTASATYEFWKVERPDRALKGLSKIDKVKKIYANICKLSGTVPNDLAKLKSSVRSTFTSVVQPAFDCVMAV